jgi:hypothetical protein
MAEERRGLIVELRLPFSGGEMAVPVDWRSVVSVAY